MADREFEPLHPRAIRIGLERVLEHQAVRPREALPLKQIYARVIEPEALSQSEHTAILNWLQDFAELSTEAEREEHLEAYLRGGKS